MDAVTKTAFEATNLDALEPGQLVTVICNRNQAPLLDIGPESYVWRVISQTASHVLLRSVHPSHGAAQEKLLQRGGYYFFDASAFASGADAPDFRAVLERLARNLSNGGYGSLADAVRDALAMWPVTPEGEGGGEDLTPTGGCRR